MTDISSMSATFLVPLIDLRAQYLNLKDRIDEAIARVMLRGNYVMGEEVEAFEEEWAQECEAKYCVGVSSGTDALYLALKSLKDINEPVLPSVLTTPLTFFATSQAILWAGFCPRFADVRNDTGNIEWWFNSVSPTLIREIPSAYLPVHLYGAPAGTFSSDSLPPVIEDSAQAHGIPLSGMAACFSFYPTKNLGAHGQAGAVVTNNRELADKVRELRTYGERGRFVNYALTGNHRLDELQAAILRAKLPQLRKWNRRRREIAQLYRELLKDLPNVRLPEDHPQHVYHIFAIRCSNRDSLAAYLREHEIQTAVRYPVPMHLQPALKLGYKEGDFPNAEAWARENLSLPIYPEMTSYQVELVASKIKEWVEGQ